MYRKRSQSKKSQSVKPDPINPICQFKRKKIWVRKKQVTKNYAVEEICYHDKDPKI